MATKKTSQKRLTKKSTIIVLRIIIIKFLEQTFLDKDDNIVV